jgi:outer membrane translocation and assembly module TamA
MTFQFDVVERPKHAVSFSAAYSTDLGVGLTTTWSDRNLFGNAEQLKLSGAVQGGGTAIKGPAFYSAGQFIKSDSLDRDQSLQADLSAVKQKLLAYYQKGISADVLLWQRFLTNWSASIGISGDAENISQEGITRECRLVGLPIAVKYDSTNGLLDPTRGVRAAATATPTFSFGGSRAELSLCSSRARPISTYPRCGTTLRCRETVAASACRMPELGSRCSTRRGLLRRVQLLRKIGDGQDWRTVATGAFADWPNTLSSRPSGKTQRNPPLSLSRSSSAGSPVQNR